MNVFLALFAWLVMAAILVVAVVMAAHGSFWLLILGFLGFVVAVARIGCLTQ
jgi:hypothetical protein